MNFDKKHTGVPPTPWGPPLLLQLEMDLEMRETTSDLRFSRRTRLVPSKRFNIAFIVQIHHPERPD